MRRLYLRSSYNCLSGALHRSSISVLACTALCAGGVMYAVLGTFALNVAADIFAVAIFAIGTNFLVGWSGVLAFGQSIFYGLSAYAVAILAIEFHIEIFVALLAGLVVSLLAGLVLGPVILRSRGLYLGLLSVGITQLLEQLALQGGAFTGAENGLFGLTLTGWFGSAHGLFAVAFFAAFGCTGVAVFLWRRPFGSFLRASRDSPLRAQAMGLKVNFLHFQAFALSAVICGLAGELGLLVNGGTDPSVFNWSEGAIPVIAIVIGGLYGLSSPVIGGLLYGTASQIVSQYTRHWQAVIGVGMCVAVLVLCQRNSHAATARPTKEHKGLFDRMPMGERQSVGRGGRGEERAMTA